MLVSDFHYDLPEELIAQLIECAHQIHGRGSLSIGPRIDLDRQTLVAFDHRPLEKTRMRPIWFCGEWSSAFLRLADRMSAPLANGPTE